MLLGPINTLSNTAKRASARRMFIIPPALYLKNPIAQATTKIIAMTFSIVLMTKNLFKFPASFLTGLIK